MNKFILVYTRRARVAPKELFVLSGHPNFPEFSSKFCICGLWFIIMDYEHNLSNDIPKFSDLQNSSKFCSFLAKSERFKRLRTDGRTEEDGRTHSSNLRPSYTKSPFGAINKIMFYKNDTVPGTWKKQIFRKGGGNSFQISILENFRVFNSFQKSGAKFRWIFFSEYFL